MGQRTNIVLDTVLIKKVQDISHESTIKGAVEYALRQTVAAALDRKAVKNFITLRGSNVWKGNLHSLRKDRV